MIKINCTVCGDRIAKIHNADTRDLIDYRGIICSACYYKEHKEDVGLNNIEGRKSRKQDSLEGVLNG